MTKSESSKGPLKAEPKLQTIILKAFIHCEGCRRKIRRIIRVVDGVEDVLVESPTGKVTITGSNIDVKAVLQRLQKYGKQAEVLLPSAPAGPSASNTSAGGKQPKPPNSNGSFGTDANEKKKQNKAGEKGEAKPDAPINNEGKKGIGMKAEELPATDQGAERQNNGGPSGSKQAGGTRKEKPVEEMKETVNEAVTAPQGDGGNGGGGGKKGKKGGNGSSNGGGSSNGVGVEHLPPPPPPPHIVQDIPIGMPASRTVSVAANRAPAPYDYIQTGYLEYNNAVDYATDMFSDENANNCSIM